MQAQGERRKRGNPRINAAQLYGQAGVQECWANFEPIKKHSNLKASLHIIDILYLL